MICWRLDWSVLLTLYGRKTSPLWSLSSEVKANTFIWQLPFLLTKMKPKEEAETDPDGMKHV